MSAQIDTVAKRGSTWEKYADENVQNRIVHTRKVIWNSLNEASFPPQSKRSELYEGGFDNLIFSEGTASLIFKSIAPPGRSDSALYTRTPPSIYTNANNADFNLNRSLNGSISTRIKRRIRDGNPTMKNERYSNIGVIYERILRCNLHQVLIEEQVNIVSNTLSGDICAGAKFAQCKIWYRTREKTKENKEIFPIPLRTTRSENIPLNLTDIIPSSSTLFYTYSMPTTTKTSPCGEKWICRFGKTSSAPWALVLFIFFVFYIS